MQDLPLVFDRPVAIVGGGTVDVAALAELAALGAAFVGADGGADVLAAAGHWPDAVIGDLDSLADPAAWVGRSRLIRIEEQETTDFEKALRTTQAPVTVALGMTGGRLDHTLAALHALQRFGATRRVILLDAHDLALTAAGPVTFRVAAGERVSVYPLSPIRFRRSRGLAYPLDGLTLAPGLRVGTSNTATEETVVIEPEGSDDVYLVVLGRHHLRDLVA